MSLSNNIELDVKRRFTNRLHNTIYESLRERNTAESILNPKPSTNSTALDFKTL